MEVQKKAAAGQLDMSKIQVDAKNCKYISVCEVVTCRFTNRQFRDKRCVNILLFLKAFFLNFQWKLQTKNLVIYRWVQKIHWPLWPPEDKLPHNKLCCKLWQQCIKRYKTCFSIFKYHEYGVVVLIVETQIWLESSIFRKRN